MTLALSADAIDTAHRRVADPQEPRTGSSSENRLCSAVAAVVRQRGRRAAFVEVLANQAALSAAPSRPAAHVAEPARAQRIRVGGVCYSTA